MLIKCQNNYKLYNMDHIESIDIDTVDDEYLITITTPHEIATVAKYSSMAKAEKVMNRFMTNYEYCKMALASPAILAETSIDVIYEFPADMAV